MSISRVQTGLVKKISKNVNKTGLKDIAGKLPHEKSQQSLIKALTCLGFMGAGMVVLNSQAKKTAKAEENKDNTDKKSPAGEEDKDVTTSTVVEVKGEAETSVPTKKFPTLGVLVITTGRYLTDEGRDKMSDVYKTMGLSTYTLGMLAQRRGTSEFLQEQNPLLKEVVEDADKFFEVKRTEEEAKAWTEQQIAKLGESIEIPEDAVAKYVEIAPQLADENLDKLMAKYE